MRKAKVISRPGERGEPVGLEAWGVSGRGSRSLLFYKHRCDDAWYEALLEELSLKGKRLSPARARQLVVAALMKGEDSDADQR
ncbi:hypothetical protein [Nitratifractor salsuginis]|uniref:Uncharacterized protein n=1 Tax=Nitratifractor salsuginis (strain DSM 16511 / JCM 12458 / E9I37-1) TaxID=749222 RepID=E6WZI7_NITSE|nr:hypothetical protein [Nitratifractor salsuginis]ADV45567.1 hypothetical protein Nitsa_0296 [Nitratifractor salsuginis DSM 16511]